jgi:L-xylulokinase
MYLLGVDIGGTMTKAVVFDYKGKEISSHSLNTPVNVSKNVYNDRDMNLMWEITAKCIRETIQKANIDPKDIKSVGCSGHGKGLYPWGKDGKPAYKAIASTDRRALDIVMEWEENGVSEKASEISLQTVIECQPAALLAWLKKYERDVYDSIQWVFEAKDYIRFMLTGEPMAEVTDYSGTSLMDLKKVEFSKELFSLFGIEEMYDCMPKLCYSHDLCGYVTKEAASFTGLAEGTPVCGGMFDIDACAVGMNVLDPEMIAVITGTWSINEYVSEEPVPGNLSTKNSLFAVPGYYLIEESSPTSAGNLDWYINNFQTHMSYKECDKLVDEAPFNDILFYPFLYGTNARNVNNASFVGLNLGHARGDILRSVYEGVVFSHRMHVENLLRYRKKPKTIRISGGSTNSDVWMQMFADCLGIPCEVVDAKELGALGACMAAGVQAGVYRDYQEAADKMVSIKRRFEPRIEYKSVFDEKYERYVKVLDALGKVGV